MRRWLTLLHLFFFRFYHRSSRFLRPPPRLGPCTRSLVNGSPILFQLEPPARLESPSRTWLGHDVSFSFDAKTKTWFAPVGVSLETAPGTYAIAGETQPGKTPGKKVTFTRKFAVAQGKYPKLEVKLNVESKFTEPTAEQQKEIEEGQQIKKDYLGRVTPEREWSGQFGRTGRGRDF
jgi:hypothetical protein